MCGCGNCLSYVRPVSYHKSNIFRPSFSACFSGGRADATGLFDGAFAAVSIKEGELIEKGVIRRLPEGFDGNSCPYIFTWSDERPNKVSGVL